MTAVILCHQNKRRFWFWFWNQVTKQ